VMRLCARGLELAATGAAHSARPASGDVQLGVALLQSGFDGSRSSLEGKLSSFIDEAYMTSVVDEIVRLSNVTSAATRAAESVLKVPPA
jgi:formiminotetrahydrofolate cyclodeaminase